MFEQKSNSVQCCAMLDERRGHQPGIVTTLSHWLTSRADNCLFLPAPHPYQQYVKLKTLCMESNQQATSELLLPSKTQVITNCCFNVGPPSSTLAQHCNNIKLIPRVFWVTTGGLNLVINWYSHVWWTWWMNTVNAGLVSWHTHSDEVFCQCRPPPPRTITVLYYLVELFCFAPKYLDLTPFPRSHSV